MHESRVVILKKKLVFPIACSGCNHVSGRRNGVREAVSKGTMQQIRCCNCGRQWSTALDNKPLLAGGRTHVSLDALLQGFALIVLGVPMCRVELLVRIKAETVKKKLLFFLQPNNWESLKSILKEQFGIPSSYLSDFESVIIGGRDFLDWSKELRRQGGADRAACARLASRILQRRVNVSEITSKN